MQLVRIYYIHLTINVICALFTGGWTRLTLVRYVANKGQGQLCPILLCALLVFDISDHKQILSYENLRS